MIELNSHRNDNSPAAKMLVIGVGNAGVNIADQMTMQSLPSAKIIAANTDSHSLMSSVAEEKLLLGNIAARGLGAGGDPEIGIKSAEESMEEIRAHLDGYSIVAICTGLGGGTGSGVAPIIAQTAREMGAFVIALVTFPFSFEGKRRARQADDAMLQLEESVDALFCFENDRMSEITQPGMGVEETFEKSDLTLGRCLASIHRMLGLPGLMRLNLNDLKKLLSGRNPRCLLGFGDSDTDNRAFDAVGKALKCPLMDRGRLLRESLTVLVHISAASDLSLAEMGVIMREIEKHTDEDCRLQMGIGVDDHAGRMLMVSIMGCLSEPVENAPTEAQQEPSRQAASLQQTTRGNAPSDGLEKTIPESAPLPRHVARMRALHEQDDPAKKSTTKPKQEFLQFDAINRGRFEKSEPTIVEGEDLDVPTFLRMKIKVK